jgi:hypothetical protein
MLIFLWSCIIIVFTFMKYVAFTVTFVPQEVKYRSFAVRYAVNMFTVLKDYVQTLL